jgi:microsomal epoxide hydrolase
VPPRGFDAAHLTPLERADLDATFEGQRLNTGYQALQATKPQTLAYGLTDSPSGLLAWQLEKWAAWTDGAWGTELREPQGRARADEVLTNVTLYWLSGCIGPSTRLYFETLGDMPGTSKEPAELINTYCAAPTGVAVFAAEIFRFPRSWCEGCYNLVRWSRFPRGGHFASLEQPRALVKDIVEFCETDAPAAARRSAPVPYKAPAAGL